MMHDCRILTPWKYCSIAEMV